MRLIIETTNQVSTHSRPKAAGLVSYSTVIAAWFQHTAARRRLVDGSIYSQDAAHVSTHSRPKAAGPHTAKRCAQTEVSTHSRPKAAGSAHVCSLSGDWSFNTQPPEGGWAIKPRKTPSKKVSTHSRPKAAGNAKVGDVTWGFSFNTQPPEGGWVRGFPARAIRECFNTQPPEGGWPPRSTAEFKGAVSTHSRPKAAGVMRLAEIHLCNFVSTHSRPKAAGW